MERIFEVAAGLDVHRDKISATVRRRLRREEVKETRSFETFRDGLEAMVAWLKGEGVEAVGMESTGVYWHCVARAIQRGLPQAVVWVVNPLQAKKVAGRKTDKKDSEWLSKLVMYGLVTPSFLPSESLHELRKLTRHRVNVVADRTRFKNRLLKELESNGIKLATICSDVLGRTGRALINAMLEGRALDQEAIELMAKGNLRDRVPELCRAVKDEFTASGAFVVRHLLKNLDQISVDLAVLEAEIHKLAAPMKAEIDRLDEMPGLDVIAATSIVAETGTDMSLFPSDKNLASWSGLCPGSEESAGKAKNAPTRKGNKYLRTILVQAAMAAKKKKGSFYQAKYRRLARLGPKKAAIALAHSMLRGIYVMLRDSVPYREPSTIPPPPNRVQARAKALLSQLRVLGFTVTVAPPSPPAVTVS
jgi:transposase